MHYIKTVKNKQIRGVSRETRHEELKKGEGSIQEGLEEHGELDK
jgi:hypothetical protein